MKVTGARLLRYRVPFRLPYRTARGSASFRDGFVVELRTSGGETGLGEASLAPDDGGDADAFAVAVQASVRAALGREVEALIRKTDGTDSACAAIEVAAWDALARSSGVPLATLLEPAAATSVPVNALITVAAPESVYEQASAARIAGYTTVKLKVGVSSSARDEVERIKAGRSALGPELKLRLDANGAWSEDVAFHMLKNFAPYEIEYLEQPIPPGDLPALRRIRDSTGVPIAADEEITDAETALRIVREGAADVLVLKPLRLGGIASCRQIARTARAAGISVTVTTSIDCGVGTAAALHLAAALGGGGAAGLATLSLLESSLIVEDLPIERGRIDVPDRGGLGVSLDEEALRRYCVGSREF